MEAYTDGNVGSCALVENAIRVFRGRYPEAEIRVMAHEPSVFEKLYGIAAFADVFEYPFLRPRLYQVGWLIKTLAWMAVCWITAGMYPAEALAGRRIPFKRKLEPFLWADLAASVGAERINDKYFKNVLFSLYNYAIAKRLGKRVVIMPATIGPFLFGWSRRLARRVLRRIDLIYTRDGRSEDTARDLIAPRTEGIVRTTDIAVLQEMTPRAEALAKIGAGDRDRIVGISAMRWSYFRNRIETPFSNYDAYVREMAKLADTLIAEHDVRVILYPTNYPVHGCREDDLTTAREIRDSMKRGGGATVIEELPTPAQLKGMLACSGLNFTTRMHACILSTGAAVPTISINYLFKVGEYMRSLGLGAFSIDIEEFNAGWALDTFSRMWPEREQWRRRIGETIERKRAELLSAMERIDDLVR
jgi:polysaccharide pyruvyl transferase WcaK-like protein